MGMVTRKQMGCKKFSRVGLPLLACRFKQLKAVVSSGSGRYALEAEGARFNPR